MNIRNVRGFSLIEGMAALLVLSVGLIALFSLQSGLLTAGSDTKARSEALQYAEQKLSELRTQARSAYPSLADFLTDSSGIFNGNSIETGTNAIFTVAWNSNNLASPSRKQATVTVSWTSPQGTQQVNVGSDLSWVSNALSAAVLSGTLPGGGTITAPSGIAEYGDDVADYTPGSPPAGSTPNEHDDGSSDGTVTYLNNGIYELIDSSSGKILLSSAGQLSTVSGRIYVESNAGTPIVTLSDISASAPDTSICISSNASGETGEIISDSLSTYFYINYTCYVGPGWYGGVGVVAVNSALGNNDEGCVGDPAETDSGHDDSKHPQLAMTRNYRGYSAKTDDSGNNQYDVDGNKIYLSQGIGANEHYNLHDFLITTINGTATDASCLTALSLNSNAEFGNNVGKKVCLSATCPSTWPVDTGEAVVTANQLTISGDISGGTMASIVTSDGDVCTVEADEYSCTVHDLGAGWTGYIEATPTSGYTFATGSSNPISFTDLSTDSSDNDFTLTAAAASQTTTITGTLDIGGGVSMSGLSLSDGGTCTYSTTFTCTTAAYTGGSWNGTLTVSHNKYLCDDGETAGALGVVTDNSTITFTGTTATTLNKNIVLRNRTRSCP